MKMHLRRTPLAVAIGVLACLAIPSVAQAHHTNSEAECVLVNNQPTIRLTAQFIDFNSTHKVTGQVWVNGTRTFNGTVPITWDNDDDGTWVYTRSAEADKSYTVETDWDWSGGSGGEKHTTNKCPTPPRPRHQDRQGRPEHPLRRRQGDLHVQGHEHRQHRALEPVVTDDKCAPVTKVPNGQNQFDPGDVWTYTCTLTITDAMGDELVNVGKVCADYKPGKPKVCDEDDHKTKIPKPKIALDKTGAATAAAGRRSRTRSRPPTSARSR